jgi:tellurite resistance-related uncharacterized protein
MKVLPSNVTKGKRTPEFTELSVPEALLESHTTKPGMWGKIVVLDGSLVYRILGPEPEEFEIDAARPAIIEPTIRHAIELHGKVRFYIQFYEQPVV